MVLILAFGACRGASAAGPSSGPGSVFASVKKVVDGDTFRAFISGVDERVRLIGVDTPEVSWYGGRAGCFGAQAARYSQGRLDGERVRLGFDVGRRDRYGRLLAYVYIGPELFNQTLVQLGYARADPVPPDTRLATLFQRTEDAARSRGAGLWSACPP